MRRTVPVSITPEHHAFLRACLAIGRYSGVSEVLRSALRLFERDEAVAPSTMEDHWTDQGHVHG